MPALHRTPRTVLLAVDPLTLRGQGAPKWLGVRSLQRSLAKVLIVAGLFVTWVPPSAQASAIYWTNYRSNTIGSANLDGTGVNESFITNLGGFGPEGPYGIAVNGTSIYWPNNSPTIGSANLDGTGVNQSFITTATRPEGGIAVDGPYIYFTEFDAIGRANLNGTGVNQSFISGLNSAGGLAVDWTYIYWTNGNAIGRPTSTARV